MKRTALAAWTLVALLAGLGTGMLRERWLAQADTTAKPAPVGATLLDGLGDYEFRITTRVPEVQRWFDQGLMLTYGFNHDAAERSYLKGTELDPQCAMCWWGAALVLGPHVNSTMDPAANPLAWQRLQRAVALAPAASERERAFIKALEARYAANPPDDRRPLDQAYAESTRALAAARPDDLDAQVFHAEALMDLQPWDFWDEKLEPKGNTSEILKTLEGVIARNPDHAGALHLYVHATEASAQPERAVAAADRLRTLIPGSGHLVHMPAHIYSRVGRWHDAVIANQVAIEADNEYLSTCRGNVRGLYPLGYVPHNPHFLWFAASMGGASAVARAAAAETAKRTNLPDLMRQPGYGGLQHYWMTPWFDDVRFGRWAGIAGKPNPAPDLPYVTAIWHYAQGMAAIRQQRFDDAARHSAALGAAANDPVIAKMLVWDRYPLSFAVQVADLTVMGELALARGQDDAAIAALRQAVAIEDQIPYDEPPAWHAPVRQALGAALLSLGRTQDAETVYREELRRNPANGWSLKGLAASLEAQGRTAEAATVEAERKKAWQHADVQLAASTF
jgi:tetratricopeptide (TPR) repeat protein